jgi:hypothetical protein
MIDIDSNRESRDSGITSCRKSILRKDSKRISNFKL